MLECLLSTINLQLAFNCLYDECVPEVGSKSVQSAAVCSKREGIGLVVA